MFTGIVEQIGALRGRTTRGPGARLVVECGFEHLVHGESIAVAGVCLTVATVLPHGFEADASAETMKRSTLGTLALGAPVDLERALRPDGRLGGHFVSGHVDGLGRLLERKAVGDSTRMRFAMPAALLPFVAEKGSICVDGVSLTVTAVSAPGSGDPAAEGWFETMIIPVSVADTTLRTLRPDEHVNLEVDVLARYVARLLACGGPPTSKRDEGAASSRDESLLTALRNGGWV